jgi:ATP-dependent DNA helicase RecG
MKDWVENATQLLSKSLYPVPQELNELDWKTDLSDKSDRIAQHISAFANNPKGGYLMFGINDNGVVGSLDKPQMDDIIKKIGNIARNNVAQPVGIDHAVIDYNGYSILCVHIPEHSDKPVYLRGADIFKSYKRSAGQTVKLSRHEVKQLIAASTGLHFEDQIDPENNSKKFASYVPFWA